MEALNLLNKSKHPLAFLRQKELAYSLSRSHTPSPIRLFFPTARPGPSQSNHCYPWPCPWGTEVLSETMSYKDGANMGFQALCFPKQICPLMVGIGRIRGAGQGPKDHGSHVSTTFLSFLLIAVMPIGHRITPFGRSGIASDDGPMPSAGRTRTLACWKGYKEGRILFMSRSRTT